MSPSTNDRFNIVDLSVEFICSFTFTIFSFDIKQSLCQFQQLTEIIYHPICISKAFPAAVAVCYTTSHGSSTLAHLYIKCSIERVAMRRYNISDMRLLYENDVRFLEQF